jgi:hypothetical protein
MVMMMFTSINLQNVSYKNHSPNAKGEPAKKTLVKKTNILHRPGTLSALIPHNIDSRRSATDNCSE